MCCPGGFPRQNGGGGGALHPGRWVDGICKKLVFRHPMSLAQGRPTRPGAEHLGRPEAGGEGAAHRCRHPGQRGQIPPALMRAEKIQDKARKAGFDWAEMGRRWTRRRRSWVAAPGRGTGGHVERSWATCSSPPSRWGALQGWTVSRPLHGTCESLSAASGGWRSWPEDGRRWTAWDCTG